MMLKTGMMALLFVASAPQAYAFAYLGQNGDRPPLTLQADNSGAEPVVWPDNRLPIAVTLNLEGAFRTSALAAMQESWNGMETRLQFVEGNAMADLCNRSDGISVVGWRDTPCGAETFGDALAVTVISFRFSNARQRWDLTDANIMFNSARSWEPRLSGPPRGVQDFRRVLIHELGHAMGLEHPDEAGQTVDAIMNSRVSSIENLTADDRRGVAFLYGGSAGGDENTAPLNSGSGGGGDAVLALLAAFAAMRGRRMRKESSI
jgi:hypothetical protein